jgi:hypothetical protein
VVLKSCAVEIIDRVRKSREVGRMDHGAYCDRGGLTGVFGVHWMSEVGSSNDTEDNLQQPPSKSLFCRWVGPLSSGCVRLLPVGGAEARRSDHNESND